MFGLPDNTRISIFKLLHVQQCGIVEQVDYSIRNLLLLIINHQKSSDLFLVLIVLLSAKEI